MKPVLYLRSASLGAPADWRANFLPVGVASSVPFPARLRALAGRSLLRWHLGAHDIVVVA